eukprot:747971-Karenia_brevis.AAC.1
MVMIPCFESAGFFFSPAWMSLGTGIVAKHGATKPYSGRAVRQNPRAGFRSTPSPFQLAPHRAAQQRGHPSDDTGGKT